MTARLDILWLMFGGTLRHRLSCLAAITLLAACNGDPEPIEPTTSPPTAESTPSNGDGPPEIPDLALEDTEAGAIAFVEHYIDVFNYAANTGDVEPLRALSHLDCEGCESYASSFEELYAAGGFIQGSEWSTSQIRAHEDESVWEIFFTVTSAQGRYLENPEGAVQELEPEQYRLAIDIPRRQERLVLEIYLTEQ